MNERFFLSPLLLSRLLLSRMRATIASIPKRFAATAASALCALMLAVPTYGQVVTIGPETTTVQEEDEDEIIFTVTADSDPSSRLTVTYAVTGTASAGDDYTAFTMTEVIFTGTKTAVEVTISIMDDHADEGDTDETIIVTLEALDGGDEPSIGAAKVATVNINDDDDAADIDHVTITNANEEELAKLVVTEQGDASYIVALSKEPTADVTLEIKVADKDKEDRLTITPEALTFTAKNWEKGQAVEVSAELDKDDVDETLMISHKPKGKDFEDNVEAAMLPVEIVDQKNPRLMAVRLSEASKTVSPQEDTYGVGEKILLDVEFTRAVTVTGTPQLKVLVGDKKDLLAEYMPPKDDEEDSAVITFAYTVQEDDEDDDGIGVPTANPLVLDEDDAIHAAKDDDDDDDVVALTEAAEGRFTVTIAADVTKVDGSKDFLLRAHAGVDQSANEDKAIKLDGSGTTSGEFGNLRYVWKFKGGKDDAPDWLSISENVTLEGDDITPDSEDEETLVTPAGDVVNFGDDEDDDLALEGETVSFSAAKSLDENITLTFELIVTNKRTRETSRDEVTVKITADDDDPVADAGDDFNAEEGTVVFLSGFGSSDPEGGDLTYSWRLKDGDDGNPAYILPNSLQELDDAVAHFQLRANITGEPELTFELTVTDADGNKSEPAEVVVTVVTSQLGEVLEHSLSRFSRALGASAVDTLGERFGPKIGHSPSGVAMNVGDAQMSFAEMGLDGAANDQRHGGMMPQGTAHAGGGVGGLGSSLAVNGASGMNIPDPFAAGHFNERLLMRGNNMIGLDREAIMRSTFEFSVGGQDALNASSGGGGGPKFAVWGRFDSRGFEAEPTDTITLDASTTIGYAGADVRFGSNQNLVLGVAVSTANSDVEYTQSDVQGFTRGEVLELLNRAISGDDLDGIEPGQLEGEIAFTMVTFHPYASIDLSNSISIWGMVGVGSGDAEITSTVDHLIETNTSMTMLALGGRSELESLGATDIAFKADGLTISASADDVLDRNIKDIETVVQRVRGGLEASRLFPMGNRSFVRGSAELAVRMDAGDAENGIGLELNAGATYESAMGLALEGRVRHLVVHSAEGIAETGFSVIGRFDPGGVGGPSVAFTPTWGDMASSADAMWQSDQPMFYDGLFGQDSDANPFRMNTQLQYAFLTPKWSLAPYGMFTTGGTIERERLGLRIRPLAMTNGNMSLDFFGEQVGGRTTGAMEPGMQATVRLLLR